MITKERLLNLLLISIDSQPHFIATAMTRQCDWVDWLSSIVLSYVRASRVIVSQLRAAGTSTLNRRGRDPVYWGDWVGRALLRASINCIVCAQKHGSYDKRVR